jgi:hypothetical protein
MNETEYELMRAKLWADTYVAHTSASNSSSKETGVFWADHAVQALDLRFKDRLVKK